MDSLRRLVRASIGTLLHWLPSGAPNYIYKNLLHCKPLRFATNTLLSSILPESVTIPEGILILNQKDPVISGALTLGVYEPYETNLFRDSIKSGMTVLDIGANIGLHMVIAARRVGPLGRVLAIEPEPENFAILHKNVMQNNFKNVMLYNIAAADNNGILELHLSDSNKGKHSLVSSLTDSPEYTESVSVPTERIDDLLARANIQQVDIIKMDIEGAEPLALRGMEKALAQKHITLFMEFLPEAIKRAGSKPEELLDTLTQKYGFTLWEIQENGRTTRLVADHKAFASRFSGFQSTNLMCIK